MSRARSNLNTFSRDVEDRALFERYRRSGSRRDRDHLIDRFLPLAHAVARRFQRGSEPLDDLNQVAAVGLIRAVDRFDASRGLPFSTFAVPTIAGEIKRHLRDHGWAVRPPRELLERALSVQRAVDRVSAEQGRAATLADLADALGDLTEAQILEALHARHAARAMSLDAPVGADADRRWGGSLAADDELGRAEQRVVLAALARTLDERERRVLHMRFVLDMTQTQISRVMGVSPMQISRILSRALERLRIVAEARACA